MATLLVRNAQMMLTMNDAGERLVNGGLYAVDGVIEQVVPCDELPETADQVLNLDHHVVMPGMVNTHHHLFQNLSRVIPCAQDAPLFGWLQTLYPLWARLSPEAIKVSTELGLVELLLSGCTTTSDHLYVFPGDCTLDHQIEAAAGIGSRFHAMRGSMSIGESQGGLPPDSLVENEQAILKDSQRLIETYHDSRDYALCRVGLAPCSPFSVSTDLMRESAVLARDYGVRLHTHLAENAEDIAYSESVYGMRPGDYAQSCGWTGDDVWHAHCVQLDDNESAAFAASGTGIAHCPCSNMRLGSGIAPVARWLEQGVPVGIGVDGSASNDAANMIDEARHALLLQRVHHGPSAITAEQTLRMATRGGARVLGRHDIGALAPGMAADFVAWRTDTLAFAGAHADLAAALVFCKPGKVDLAVVQGRVLVQEGQLTMLDLPALLSRHQRVSADLINGH